MTITENGAMNMSVNEIWKPVKGYEGLYEVSNLGKVKTFHPKENNIILKPYLMKNGYMQVCLYSKTTRKKLFVHRLVAEAFIPNPDNFTQVNHIDENKQNNCVENLEWVTHLQNMAYGTRLKRQAKTLIANEKLLKPVCCFSKNGELLQIFKSVKEASEITGANQTSISRCCKGRPKYNTAGGYVWKYHKKEGDIVGSQNDSIKFT